MDKQIRRENVEERSGRQLRVAVVVAVVVSDGLVLVLTLFFN
jgi:hypothetical protein